MHKTALLSDKLTYISNELSISLFTFCIVAVYAIVNAFQVSMRKFIYQFMWSNVML